ncbi:MAG: hypothetical protein WCE75_01990 [Terracidiphilus sp.]
MRSSRFNQANEQASQPRWRPRDTAAVVLLFSATAAFVLWQNARVSILWDASYTLDTGTRIAQGQLPYRDFPLAHAPLTFLVQALIIRLAGRVYFYHVLYAAAAAGAATLLAWRIALNTLRARVTAAWSIAVLLAAPLAVLGIYCVLPFPSYDCDCALAVLLALFCWQRLPNGETPPEYGRQWKTLAGPFLTGVLLSLPLFFKQNIGLPFLAVAVVVLCQLVARTKIRHGNRAGAVAMAAVLSGAVAGLLLAALVLHLTVGVGNYLHWTIGFAAARRMPGAAAMLAVYREPGLLWQLPSVAAGLLLLRSRFGARLWARLGALALLAAPFLWALFSFLAAEDSDDRADALLALWPLLLVLSCALAVHRLLRDRTPRGMLPLLVLAAIHGTLLSQQLWGSTYAIWPLFMLLLAELARTLGGWERSATQGNAPRVAPLLAAVAALVLLVCGGFYAASQERLSYAHIDEGELRHSSLPELKGMAVRGDYLPEFEELLRFAAGEIPPGDGLILLPGEDPFYFATGRRPRFPVLLFDPATDPLSPAQLAAEARSRGIRWLVVKRHLQIREDMMPEREAALDELKKLFRPYRTLRGYEIYRRAE